MYSHADANAFLSLKKEVIRSSVRSTARPVLDDITQNQLYAIIIALKRVFSFGPRNLC